MAHRMFHGRSLARAQALQLLFQAEMRDISVEDLVAEQVPMLVVDPLDERSGEVSLDEYGRVADELGYERAVDDYAFVLAGGVEGWLDTFDGIISERSNDWALERMPLVDRNLMRIALFEMIVVPEVAIATAIDECVELAKAYGSEDTPSFVNGILGRVADKIEAGELSYAQAS